MHSFEKYLIEKGYKKNILEIKNNKVEYVEEKAGRHSFSSMMNISYYYIKGDSIIVWGLHENHKPPILISPRPSGVFYDETMFRVFEKYSNEDVFDALFNNLIILSV